MHIYSVHCALSSGNRLKIYISILLIATLTKMIQEHNQESAIIYINMYESFIEMERVWIKILISQKSKIMLKKPVATKKCSEKSLV